ncbi:MAG: GntR family transcriptional regulator [Chloroflexi bacterium]|nr:GntR family transcriptional regulator [Chloroflexota bacterium]
MQLDEKSPIPLYYQLKQILAENIKSGAWEEGKELLPERALAKEYAVSLGTVRQALQELVREGLIERRRGRGTFVAHSKLALSTHFVRELRAQGLAVRNKLVSAHCEETPPKGIAEILNLASSEQVYMIMRVWLVNEEPLALETLYISARLAPDLLSKDLEHLAIFPYIQKQHQAQLAEEYRNAAATSTLTAEAVLLSEFESSQLGGEVASPAILLERTSYLGKMPVGFQKRVARGDRCKLVWSASDADEAGMQFQIR